MTEPNARARLSAYLAARAPEVPTVTQAADAAGVSRQRVQQIAKSLGVALLPSPRSGTRRARARVVPFNRAAFSAVFELVAAVNDAARDVSNIGRVVADLIARGRPVYCPASTLAPCDLVMIAEDGRAERLRVVNAAVRFELPAGLVDRVAIVAKGEPVRYVPAM